MTPSVSSGRRAGWPARFSILVGAALLLANLATLATLFGSRWWLFELVTHFPVQLAAAQIGGLIWFGIRGRARPILATLPFLLINVAAFAPYYLPTRVEAASVAKGGGTLRIMTLNLQDKNDRIDLVERVVARENPDIILFVEATPLWYVRLEHIRERYPYEVRRIIPRRYTLLLVSRLPFREAQILTVGAAKRPVAAATICPDGGTGRDNHCLTILGGHPPRPRDAITNAVRNDQLLGMASLAARHRDGRVVMLGDFNTTPYSPIFPEVLKIGRLRDSALGFVPQTTWQSRFPLFGLPIDHILVGHGVSLLDRHVGAGVGSDHFPVIADLAF